MAISFGIDIPVYNLYSRIEREKCRAKPGQVIDLSLILNVKKENLLCMWLADRIFYVIHENYDHAHKISQTVLKIAI